MGLRKLMIFRCCFLICAISLGAAALAGPAPFDLAGPILEVKITRDGITLPASEVPNLAPGDRVWIKTDLPETQSVQYLMVAAFLSGSTNPPPEKWFFACKIWTAKCGREGLTVTVPPGAQQVLVFLAPHTGGDLRTVIGAVRGRPGAFVRTSQDLNQAALDRSRLDRFLSAVRVLNEGDPAKLKEAAPLLARSLAIKVEDKCLDRLPELQAPCLMQGQESLILNDGHSTSIVEALTSGPGSDLAMEASYTPQLSYGYYSPYIASVLDIARIMESFRSAQYQYIPALASPLGDKLALTLNMAPSFHNPKSVLVIALPAVESAQLPPLHAVDPKEIFCIRRSTLVLPVDGAPLAFSTAYAHDLTLDVTGRDGKTIALAAKADPIQGGYVVDTSALGKAALGDSIHASLKGYWGFNAYEGPTFRLINVHAKSWELAAGDEASLIVGRQDTVHLQADSVSCVDAIMLKDPGGKELKVDWKTTRPDEVEIKLPLQAATPGAMTLLVQQYGDNQPDPIPIHTFADAGRIDGFSIHSGDIVGTLKGNRLDEVASLSFKNNIFVPGELATNHGVDELPMVAEDPNAVAALKPEHGVAAKVSLKDGRVFPSTGNVEAPRPVVTLLGMNVQPSASIQNSNILLAHPSELPQDAILTFSVRTQSPAAFARDENIEVTTGDESSSAMLNFSNGGVMLENSQVAVATLNPAKAFGGAAFGPLQFRVNSKGVVGDWQPLANLVRLPVLKELKCPATPELACKLTGANLFLIDSIADDQQFTHPVKVPDGFLGSALPVPHPKAGSLYVKLRDDPSVVNATTVSAQEIPPSPAEAARTEVRSSALPAPAPAPAQPDTGAPKEP
ncbi:MAG TPA: hypothetical protein VHW71_14370 [Steroidobacteraceae bacterium]|jgi:hypothetical protein|nr:hypothetical protein [Steroidobacteraceae bacterium]